LERVVRARPRDGRFRARGIEVVLDARVRARGDDEGDPAQGQRPRGRFRVHHAGLEHRGVAPGPPPSRAAAGPVTTATGSVSAGRLRKAMPRPTDSMIGNAKLQKTT